MRPPNFNDWASCVALVPQIMNFSQPPAILWAM